jgi:hypothetical protein
MSVNAMILSVPIWSAKNLLVFLAVFYQSILMNSCTVRNFQEQTDKPIVKQTPETMNLTKNHSLFIQLALGSFDPLSGFGPPVLDPELTIRNYPDPQAGYYILQFKGPVSQEWKDAVTNTGARLFDYIPQFTFIVKMNAQAYKNIQTMPSVRWIGIYQPGYRVAPGLMPKALEKGEQLIEIVVSLFQDEDVESILTEFRNMKAEITAVSEKKDRIILKLPSSCIIGIARMNGVKFIEAVSAYKLF